MSIYVLHDAFFIKNINLLNTMYISLYYNLWYMSIYKMQLSQNYDTKFSDIVHAF